jgi:hypothetical protein
MFLQQNRKPTINFSLFLPHKIRYKYPITDKTKPISLTTGRFAAAKVKHQKTWCMRGGCRYVFNMKHERAGNIGIIVHPRSMEVYQRDRHQIPSASLEDATNQLAIAINDVAHRFVQEQGWESVNFSLGQPTLVGSPHYAARSELARAITDKNQTQLQFVGGLEVDKSLEDKYKDPKYAEIEGQDIDVVNIVDQGLKNAYNLNTLLPGLVAPIIKTEITTAMAALHTDFENLTAHINAGNTMQYQFNQMAGLLSSTLKTMHELQDEIKLLKQQKSEN